MRVPVRELTKRIGKMTTAERRISQLEKVLKRETDTNRAGHNYYKVGYTQFELSQLYKLSGVSVKSKELLKEAFLTLQNPECKKGKRTDKLANLISFCISNPAAPPFVQLPAMLRYLSPIVLLVGYAGAYAAYFSKIISDTAFFAIVLGVFVSSLVVTGLAGSSYVKKMRKDYTPQQQSIPGFTGSRPNSDARDPDDVIDDARAELSLANMYYSTKNLKEMEEHLEKARTFLNNPVTKQSSKKVETEGTLNKLEIALSRRKSGDHRSIQ